MSDEQNKETKNTPAWLTPFNQMSPEKAREIRAKGGKAGAKVAKAKKDLRYISEQVLKSRIEFPMNRDDLLIFQNKYTDKNGVPKTLNVGELMTIAIAAKAINGNVEAARYLRDTADQAPVKKVQADIRSVGFAIDWGTLLDDLSNEEDTSEMNDGVEADE